MKFGRWYPLAEVALHAPAGPGVFQIRSAEQLFDYPRGKSAMLHYEAARDVRAAAIAFASDYPSRAWLCRHTIEMTEADAASSDTFAAHLVRDFVTRFGQPPTKPSAAPVRS